MSNADLEIQIPGYQKIVVEKDFPNHVYLYIGDNYVCFTQEQWEDFRKEIVEFK